MRRLVLAVSVASFFLGSVSKLAADSRESGGGSPARPGPAIHYESYGVVASFGPPMLRAALGRLRVPENRSSGSPRSIELAFVRLPSTARRPGAPILWLAGGPGRSGIEDLDTPLAPLLFDLRRFGDVIVLDQRGTGLSTPRLDCPSGISFSREVPLRRGDVLEALEVSAKTCSEFWSARGVDLAAYNTRESAEDVDDLRAALGVERLRLLAGSYGTHLALAAMRAHPDRIERAALIGIVGPDHLRRVPSSSDRPLESVARLMRSDAGLAARLPDLMATVAEVRNRLATRPVTVTVSTPEGPRSIAVGRFDLDWYTRALLSDRALLERLPAVYSAMAGGDFSELGAIALAWRTPPPPSAVMFAMRCASGGSDERERRIAAERSSALLGEAADLAESPVCRAWGVPRLPNDFRAPVVSEIPTLFVSGTLDGDTPEENASEVAAGFRNAIRLTVDGATHTFLGFEAAEERAAVVRFFDGGLRRPEHVRRPALTFARPAAAPADVVLANGRDRIGPLFGGGMP